MDGEAEKIRRRIEALPKRGNKRQYTAAVKQAVLDFVAQCGEAGQTEAAACKAIGMHQATVSEWRGGRRPRDSTKAKRPTRVRPVEVAPAHVTSSLTLQFPGGARVEGLALSQVIELAKALQ